MIKCLKDAASAIPTCLCNVELVSAMTFASDLCHLFTHTGMCILQLQHMAVTCIQRNVKKFMAIRNWSWWRLYTKIRPLLDVHRTEEELRNKDVGVSCFCSFLLNSCFCLNCQILNIPDQISTFRRSLNS